MERVLSELSWLKKWYYQVEAPRLLLEFNGKGKGEAALANFVEVFDARYFLFDVSYLFQSSLP